MANVESLIRVAPVNVQDEVERHHRYSESDLESNVVLPKVAGFLVMVVAQHNGTPVMIDRDIANKKFAGLYPYVLQSLEDQYGEEAVTNARDGAINMIKHYGLGSFAEELEAYMGPTTEELEKKRTSIEMKNNVREFVEGFESIDKLDPQWMLKREINAISEIDELDKGGSK